LLKMKRKMKMKRGGTRALRRRYVRLDLSRFSRPFGDL